MKMSTLIMGLLFSLALKCQQPDFAVKARFTQLPPGKFRADFRVIVSPQSDTLFFSDSVSREKETINVTGYLETETLATLSIRGIGVFDFALGPNDSVFLVLPAKKFMDSFSVSGSSRTISMVNYIYKRFRQQSVDLRSKQARIDSLLLNHAAAEIVDRSKRTYDSTYDAYFNYDVEFADTVNSASAVFYALSSYFGQTGKYDIYPNIEKALLKYGNTAVIESLKLGYSSRVKDTVNTFFEVGTIMPMNQIFNARELKAIKNVLRNNKLVLIDFWASWCGPCRIEFPFLNKAYKEFKPRKFDIISISFDKKDEDWKKAVRSLSPLWKNQFLDRNAWNSKIVQLLNIKSIPRNYLVDENGKIYAKDLRGGDLRATLKKFL